MDIQNLLEWTDQQVLAKTGKHLDSLQESILQGIWNHQDYEEIAENNQRSYDHVKKEAWKLWQLLSDVFEEDIKKSNVRSILETKASSIIYHFANSLNSNNISNNHVNICRENNPYSENNLKKSAKFPDNEHQSPIIDLTKAPELKCNYGRNLELSTLKEWIENKTRLITIYGLTGIGKTALTLKLISEIATQFDYIIYRSLENIPKLIDLKEDLKQFFAQSPSTPLPDIIDYLGAYRCLIILDDVQTIFKPGELAGQYLPDYKDYHKFFNHIATHSHQSCLILLSWELAPDLEILERDNQYINILHLKGLGEDAQELLRQNNLKNQELWDQLINLYQGHPAWLNIISLTLQKLYNNRLDLFLTDESELFLGDIVTLLEYHLERLSELETKLILMLSRQDNPLNLEQIPKDLKISKAKLTMVIQSLIRRSLIEKTSQGEISYFELNPMLKAVIISSKNVSYREQIGLVRVGLIESLFFPLGQ